MTKVLVGIDSGGTRTNVSLKTYNEDTASLEAIGWYETTDDSLSAVLPPELVSGTLARILSPIASRLDSVEDPEAYLWISAAGFSPPTRDTYMDALNDVAPHCLGGRVAALGAANDAVTGLLGHDADAIVVAGTGSNLILRGSDGGLHQVGGDDWVASDNGSGFWIGLRGIREAYRDYERGSTAEQSTLLSILLFEYRIKRDDRGDMQDKMLSLAVGDRFQTKNIARFAQEVCSAASKGDLQAQDIVSSEAEDLADMTAMGFRRLLEQGALAQGLDIVLAGAVLTNEFYRTRFEAQLRMRLRGYAPEEALRFRSSETLTEAAIRLAARLVRSRDEYHAIGDPHRPVVLSF